MPEAEFLYGNRPVILLLSAVLTVLVGLLFVHETRQRSRRRFWKPAVRLDLTDPGQQLNAVMAGSFEKKRLLSKSEYRIFKVIEDDVIAARIGYRVFAQTCLGEIPKSPDQDAYRSINSKRADILVVDPCGWPVLAIEYQGSGHYQGTAAARDAVKKEALRKAGVGYLEFSPDDSDEKIRARVREYLGWSAGSN